MLTIFLTVVFFAVITAAESLALTIGGAVAVGVTWLINAFFQTKGTVAFLITIAVSVVVALLSLLISGDPSIKLLFSGDFSNLGELYKAGVFVVGVATTVYKLLLADRNKPRSA